MKRTTPKPAARIRIGYLCGLIGVLLLSGSAGAVVMELDDTNAEPGDGFGTALTRGDFNGDGYDDLAVGLPFENLADGPFSAIHAAGAVEVIYGSEPGLTAVNRQFLRQGAGGVDDAAEPFDYFGCSLAAGDFNDDGYSDLAIGVCGEDVDGVVDAGAVNVIHGSPLGISATTILGQFWHQGLSACVPTRTQPCVLADDMAEAGDLFGRSLAARDLDGDGDSELAVGIPFEDVGSILDAGAVRVIYGSAAGLSESAAPVNVNGEIVETLWHQDSPGIPDKAEPSDYFALSLASGDFNGDGLGELAIGIPYEDIGIVSTDEGAVNVIDGIVLAGLCSSQSCSTLNQFWHQDLLNPPHTYGAESGDLFGWSLAVGNFSGFRGPNDTETDRHDDLAIGAPFEDIGPITNAGAVNVIFGAPDGLRRNNSQFWQQNSKFNEMNTPLLVGSDMAEPLDYFGYSLAAGDFDSTQGTHGFEDLAIGVPFEDIGSVADAGAVNIVYSHYAGPSTGGNQFWHQDTLHVENVAKVGDWFGFALAAGAFHRRGAGVSSLAIGIPGEDLPNSRGSLADAGAVGVLFGDSGGCCNVGGLSAIATPDQFWTQILAPIFQQ